MAIEQKIAVIIPTYRACRHILKVIELIGSDVAKIYVVDDCCPDNTGSFVESKNKDSRVAVIRNIKNQGVGGATMTGYKAAIKDGMDILVKIDSDGQMDPSLILDFVIPIISGEADYTKGNRFFDIEKVQAMPRVRLFGNALLSFMCKLSSGYWNIFDPTNGYTAIHSVVASKLPFSKISRRYFFETDVLFRLNTLRAMVIDVPIEAKYGDEISHLKISQIVGEFAVKHFRNFCKRIFYNYYLRDMSLASIELPLGVCLLSFGSIFGGYRWALSVQEGISASTGTVMLAVLSILTGLQLFLSFIGYDMASMPQRPVHKSCSKAGARKKSSGGSLPLDF